jgi:acyl-CoA synthetase (AMP-forming)/AMP-acid ligase II
VLSVLPLFHTYGLYQLIMTVRVGATLVLRQGMGLPGELVRTLRRESISVLPGVPTMWHVLTTFAPDGGRLLPRLRLLTNAGAAMPAARLERLRAAFPSTDVIPIYGQTECKSACYLPSGEVDIRPGSVGVALPGTAVRLVGNDGGPVRHGEVGELYIRGDHVMQGYWNDVEATARALVPSRLPGDRELRSGDLFRADADGFMYFVARKDDIIISRGEKVAPREVEDVLLAAPGVRDVAVVGVPDELRGAAVVAFVSPEAGQVLDPDLLRRKCAEHLEDHQMPVAVHVLDALPRLDTGKIDRVALVARATAPRLPVRPRARTLTQVVPQPSKHLSRVGVSEHAAET